MSLPRGIANRNPMNIRSGVIIWAGQCATQYDPEFVQFVDAEHGLRAGMRILLNYQHVHGLRTIAEIIARWAPPAENDTGAYVADVADRCGIDRDQPLALDDAGILARLGHAIVRHENGPCPTAPDWYPDALYFHAAIEAGARAPQENLTS